MTQKTTVGNQTINIFQLSMILMLCILCNYSAIAQRSNSAERYGNTLNIGVGVGYYGYINNPLPVAIINYEIDVVRNFTLAPFIGFYSYRNDTYGYNYNPNGYTYRETVAPIGVKASYYFDQLFRANKKWDFYAAGSLAFVIRRVTWDNGYYGNHNVYDNRPPVYIDAHVGAEYHLTSKVGLFLDVSTGVSTGGVAFHFN